MIHFSLFALLLTGVANADAKPDRSLPGFSTVQADVKLFEPLGRNNKPLLRLVRADYDEQRKLIIWLLELQADIDFNEKMSIDAVWSNPQIVNQGPIAYFFDSDHVAVYVRELKLGGKLYEGKKGDRIRLVMDASGGFPNAATMELRRP